MIGTPCYDGKVELDYMKSLIETMKLCNEYGIDLQLQFLIGNSLIQTARNEIFSHAIEQQVDDLVFIDSDQDWKPEYFIQILSHDVDIIGGVVPGKNDQVSYNPKALESGFKIDENGLVEVKGVGTGFMRISKRALELMWSKSAPYFYEHKQGRSVFEAKVIDGHMVGEDIGFCFKWRDLGEKVYIDPAITCGHIGRKKWVGNFLDHLKIVGGL